MRGCSPVATASHNDQCQYIITQWGCLRKLLSVGIVSPSNSIKIIEFEVNPLTVLVNEEMIASAETKSDFDTLNDVLKDQLPGIKEHYSRLAISSSSNTVVNHWKSGENPQAIVFEPPWICSSTNAL